MYAFHIADVAFAKNQNLACIFFSKKYLPLLCERQRFMSMETNIFMIISLFCGICFVFF